MSVPSTIAASGQSAGYRPPSHRKPSSSSIEKHKIEAIEKERRKEKKKLKQQQAGSGSGGSGGSGSPSSGSKKSCLISIVAASLYFGVVLFQTICEQGPPWL